MDSLTQIVLGAAVSEAALGKKIGNRAMVWGAIAGTIPDLDVVSNLFMTPIQSLAFHRGITHSALIDLLLALGMGFIVHKMYAWHNHKWVGMTSWLILLIFVTLTPSLVSGLSVFGVVWSLIFGGIGGWLVYHRYQRPGYKTAEASIWEWQWMFILALVTHPILDCFTTYGTQILLPFSTDRVSFNNIAVADPAYTLPFLTCVIIAMFYKKDDPKRRFWNYLGLTISSLYMLFTIYNKSKINTIFTESLDSQGIIYNRYMTSPTILNNVLWTGIAETDSAYYYGSYSFFDKEKKINFNKLKKSDQSFSQGLSNDPTLKTLRWFSNDYFILEQANQDSLKYYDLRFGTFRTSEKSEDKFVFNFDIQREGDTYTLLNQGNGPKDTKIGEIFKVLWRRMMGNVD